MSITLEELKILAALNPYRWDQLTQDELDERVARSGLKLACRPLAGDPRRPGIGKSVITKAVLQRIAEEDTDLTRELDDIRNSSRRSTTSVFLQDDWERLVFEHLELHLKVRSREALTRIAEKVRGEKLSIEPCTPRRAM